MTIKGRISSFSHDVPGPVKLRHQCNFTKLAVLRSSLTKPNEGSVIILWQQSSLGLGNNSVNITWLLLCYCYLVGKMQITNQLATEWNRVPRLQLSLQFYHGPLCTLPAISRTAKYNMQMKFCGLFAMLLFASSAVTRQHEKLSHFVQLDKDLETMNN